MFEEPERPLKFEGFKKCNFFYQYYHKSVGLDLDPDSTKYLGQDSETDSLNPDRNTPINALFFNGNSAFLRIYSKEHL